VGPLGRRVEQAEDREQGRLAAAGRSGNRHVFAARDVEVHAGQRVGFDLVGQEHLLDAVEADQRFVAHGFVLGSRWVAFGTVVPRGIHSRRIMSCWSQALVSDRITRSPTFRPWRISMRLTDALPGRTGTRVRTSDSGSTRNRRTSESGWPNAGRPT